MDELARYNKQRWEELASAGVMYSRPLLNLDLGSARRLVDAEGIAGEIEGKDVLCLAGGGGQQSAAFAILRANITVLDLSETQLDRDKQVSAHYNLAIETVQGDMRDLSRFDSDAFDIVWHAHSLNFVPDARGVFREVARVIRPGGLYRVHCANPFVHGVSDTWSGEAYLLKLPYDDGLEVDLDDPYWEFEGTDGEPKRIMGPREFRHSLSSLVNGLIEQRFAILGVWEGSRDEPNPEPGTWEHFKSIAPPWLTFWASYVHDRSASVA